LRAFGKHFRCLALDNRDVGQSRGPAVPYTTADMAADVAGLMERLQLPPAHVVGLSLGGMIAQELALAAPQRVKSLALVDALDRAARISCPALVLVGADDAVCPPRYSEQLRDVLPQARLVVVSGVGHALPFEDPGRFTALLAEFLGCPRITDRRCA